MSHDIDLKTFLSFDQMIAPTVIKVVYWIGLAFISLGSLITFFTSFVVMGHNVGAGFGQMLLSVIGFVLGVLFWRIIMEIYIVFFSIHDRLSEIRDRLPPPVNQP
ncbi:hypothetical protein JCM17845_05850 [Iodidimonas gelatinilytica]|uniref:DUF4282 domain-containing protein n=1 Tax=Iodidimonas gelatinilytica TaxID=1236966 RepID=A0A5A7MVL5_9PROT|nr:DUF4282 domain-containing protein [Iodidimonas gelatinilytica]GEQ99961.1 hypothetical protein JCM17845_05850 [Iodidimonas gelatinilytica]